MHAMHYMYVYCMYYYIQWKVSEYGHCPNTENIGISETITPTKQYNEYNIHYYINNLNTNSLIL